jgi:hypothetical protein
MSENRDLFKAIAGQSWDQWTKIDTIPPIDSSIGDIFDRNRSRYPLCVLGHTSDGTAVSLLREQRKNHLHVIGTTDEGKSKLFELLMRGDVDLAEGLLFLDPSELGDTMYKVAKYCKSVGHKKVLIIDPRHYLLFNKVLPINPFLAPKEIAVSNVKDAIRVLFGVKDWSENPIINRYLPAILSVLWNAKLTLYHSIYFTDLSYAHERRLILNRSPKDDRHRIMLETVFNSSSKTLFYEFQSTVRRLEPLYHPALKLIFGSVQGVDFKRLIDDKWVILVNMYSGMGLEEIHTRLLGTIIINEVISAMDRLRANGWNKKYYLYLDEAGRYANRNLADLLAYKRKSGLDILIAHQYWSQFDDRTVLDAIRQTCKIKVAFSQPDPSDRLETVKMMYGGELQDRQVSYALSTLKKRHCVVKFPKKEPRIIQVRNIPDIKVDLKSYITKLLENPLYRTPEEIIKEQTLAEKPYDTSRESDIPSKKTSKAASRPVSKDSAPHGPGRRAEQSDLFRRIHQDEVTHPEDDKKQPS